MVFLIESDCQMKYSHCDGLISTISLKEISGNSQNCWVSEEAAWWESAPVKIILDATADE